MLLTGQMEGEMKTTHNILNVLEEIDGGTEVRKYFKKNMFIKSDNDMLWWRAMIAFVSRRNDT